MTRNLFLDFDGTIIDSRQRQYQLFCDLVPESQFSFDQYWVIKRKKISQSNMLKKYFGYDSTEIASIHEIWMREIEDPVRLALDRPFDGIDAFLNEASKCFTLYLVTARQTPDFVIKQIDKFGWSRLFSQILVTEQSCSKSELIDEKVDYSASDIIIGDTGEDIITGKSLGLGTIAVTYGTLGCDVLKGYSPDYLVESAYKLNEALQRLYLQNVYK